MNGPHGHKKRSQRTALGILPILIAALLLPACIPTMPAHTQEDGLFTQRARRGGNKRIAADVFARGSTYQMRGLYADAIQEFEKALKYDESAAIHLALAECYMELDDLLNAGIHIRNGLELNPDFLPLYEAQGRLHLYNSRIDLAIDSFRFLDERQPHSLTPKVTLARLYELRDLDTAIMLYEEVLERRESEYQDENFPILAKLADLYEATGDSTRYIEVLEKMNESTTALDYLPFQLMQAYTARDDLAKAHALMQSAAYTVPVNDVDYYLASYAGLLLNRVDTVNTHSREIDEYTEFIEQVNAPGWLAPYYAALLLYDSGRRNQAERYFDIVLDRADSLEEVPIRVALHYLRSEQYMRAIDLLSRHEEKFPENPEYPFYQGMAWQQFGDNQRAVEEMTRAARIAPDFVDAWVQLGNLYSILLDHAESDAAYERALELAPDNALINNNYAYALSERGVQLERAQRMAESALAGDPDNASYLDTMGWIYFQLGQYERALTYIRRSVDIDPASATVYEHLGDCYAKLGETDKARDSWLRALELEPDRDSTMERLGRGGG